LLFNVTGNLEDQENVSLVNITKKMLFSLCFATLCSVYSAVEWE